ncbi:MAG: DUF2958 domain-containing protein [Pseudomonadota bacterium]|nr:DUF2958 domain-containing protein [Pseudomonadota bacterium]
MTPSITGAERAQLIAGGLALAAGKALDPVPVVRLFTPDANATWLLASLDPTDGDTAHGLIDLGIGMPALGKVKLSDLTAIVGPRRQPVMRDRYFQPVRRLSEYLRLAPRKMVRSPTDELEPTAAHCVFFGLTSDHLGLNGRPCIELVRT